MPMLPGPLKRVMCAIAIWRILGLLASAKPNCFGFREFNFYRLQGGVFSVGIVTTGLILAQSTGTP